MSARRVFIDTNVLGYLLSDDERKARVTDSLLRAKEATRLTSTQVVGEFVNFARKKTPLSWGDMRIYIETFREACDIECVTIDDQIAAVAIAERYRFSWFDSLIVATALRLGADKLYSEDLQHGQQIGPMQIQNPFIT
ncbi:MAG: hypothetical protein A3E78_09465 [Alphaproteobacteria bacterium RIFCSPHIGHO2_12_FULL_63_12]|nr:MAG: hypothetical protein A3E78_09465 [Alphaproteobacteria bacterium RIFCSPHIGHO2_12_FULL_63_12]